MLSENVLSENGQAGMAISAKGGIMIGLTLAVAVILGGFSLALGTHAPSEAQAFPAWVDQRFANENESRYQSVPTSPGAVRMIVVAEAR
jgi:hypothetical protein